MSTFLFHRPTRAFVSLVVSCAIAAIAVPAFAHHGWSEYDDSSLLTVKGKVSESRYENPHAVVTVNAEGANAKKWVAILAPVSRMQARGATREAVAVGQEVTLHGYASKKTPNEMRVERITLGDKTVELR